MLLTICASIDFSPQIIDIKKQLEQLGHQVTIPYSTIKIMNGDLSIEEYLANKEATGGDLTFRQTQPVDMIIRYWNSIRESDAILVLNLNKKGIDNYIGGSTLMEMGFAYGHGKKIFLFNPLPTKSERIHYLDEIISLKPIIINGDLKNIS